MSYIFSLFPINNKAFKVTVSIAGIEGTWKFHISIFKSYYLQCNRLQIIFKRLSSQLAQLLEYGANKNYVMKKTINAHAIKTLFAAVLMLMVNIAVQAQEKVTVTHTETQTTNWLSDNWMWVAGGVLLLIILIALGSSSSRRTTTTRDNLTGTTTTTTVED